MKTIEATICCVAIFLTIIHKAVQSDLYKVLNKMSKHKDENVNGVFKPKQLVGELPYAFVYSGTLLPSSNDKAVAMKFYPAENEKDAQHEYTMLTYLNAINNPSVELYGIPSVYYYGHWRNHTILAITLVDFAFEDILRRHLTYNEVDVMIMFQGFVRVLKYMHSRGIALRNIGINNLMIYKNQVFIADFHTSVDIYRSNSTSERPLAEQDWGNFINIMHAIVEDKMHWLQFKAKDLQKVSDQIGFMAQLIEDGKKNRKFIGLRRVFIEFVNYASNKYPWNVNILYDQLYKIIEHEMGRYSHSAHPLFSWMIFDDEISEAESIMKAMGPISSIKGTFGLVDPKYPEVKFDYFNEIKNSGASSSK